MKWDYKVISTVDYRRIENTLNAAGSEGWEAFAVVYDDGEHRIFLKRPK